MNESPRDRAGAALESNCKTLRRLRLKEAAVRRRRPFLTRIRRPGCPDWVRNRLCLWADGPTVNSGHHGEAASSSEINP